MSLVRTPFLGVLHGNKAPLICGVLSMLLVGCGGSKPFATPPPLQANNVVVRWNEIALEANKVDHTPAAGGIVRKEQSGPGRSARALAIVHIAIYDAVNAISHRYKTVTNIADAPSDTSMEAAVAQAGHDTLVALYTGQIPSIDRALTSELSLIPDTPKKTKGIAVGREAAALILAEKRYDGSDDSENTGFVPTGLPMHWAPDPMNPSQKPWGPGWGAVQPFVIKNGAQFRCPPPPSATSPEYKIACDEIMAVGGDGVHTSTQRTEDQTEAGLYWAYDGVPGVGTPPRLYNQITQKIASERVLDTVEYSRLFAVVNTAMADASIAIWESKYAYDFCRPITGLRNNTGSMPQDASFIPLGAPNSNASANNFTPPFPAYPSGHAGFGGALFETLREFFGTDDISFNFVSDELNGKTRDNKGNVRPYKVRFFNSLSQAEEENGQSRMYLGIHWVFDKTAGIDQGRAIAKYVYNNAFQRRSP